MKFRITTVMLASLAVVCASLAGNETNSPRGVASIAPNASPPGLTTKSSSASAQLFLTLRAHPMQMRLALQPDDTLVSASVDGVRFWRAPKLPLRESAASY